MKLKLYLFIAVNVILGLVGALLIFWGITNKGEIARPFLESIGVGFIAAAIVNIFDRALTLEPPPVLEQRIEVVAEKRLTTPQYILDAKYEASKIDIIGVSITHALEDLVNDQGQRIIDRLLKNNLQLRLFFVHPESPYLEQRAREDKRIYSDLVKRQKHAVELSKAFYDQLCAAYNSADQAGTLDTHLTGSLQIKLLEFCPYMTLYRLDEDEIYWGLYTSSTAGVDLPLFKTSNKVDPSFYKHLHQHIHALLERDQKYPLLVEMPEMGVPNINIDLFNKIMGR